MSSTFFELGVVVKLGVIVYIISYTVTESALFDPLRTSRRLNGREKLRDLLSCHFCFSFWVSFAIAAIYGYMLPGFGNFFFDVFFNGLLLVFVANLLYVIMEILRNFRKLIESADYWVYRRGKD